MPSPLQITWLFILISTATIMVGGIWVAGTGTLARGPACTCISTNTG